MVPKGDGADASLLEKLSVGLAMSAGTAGPLGGGEPKAANGEGAGAAPPPPPPPPKTLLLAPIEANGDAEDEASFEKPEAANADEEVCAVLSALPGGLVSPPVVEAVV